MAEPTPTVSVIIIFLNPSAAFLDEAIASVRAQTLADWELLLVDDGSSDDSSEAARAAAAAKPDRVRYLEHPDHANCGMSASRNLGIGAARGRYLTFLDADDVYLPERLAHQVALLDDHPEVGMVYGPTLYWHSWRPDAPGRDAVSRLGLPVGVPLDPPRVMRAFLETHGGIVPGICSLTVRRDAALAVGCFEAAFRGCYEDQVFLSKICTNETIMLTDRWHAKYRQHASSCTAQAVESGDYQEHLPHPTRERYLRWLASYLETAGVNNPALLRALRRELWPYDHPRLHRRIGIPLLLARLRAKRWIWQQIRRVTGDRRPTVVPAGE
ncbi:MAG: glycosyltransferase [Geminicoccaceae bacterium]